MRQFSIFIVCAVILGWGYLSWRYYSCTIKGFCGEDRYISQFENETVPVYENMENTEEKESSEIQVENEEISPEEESMSGKNLEDSSQEMINENNENNVGTGLDEEGDKANDEEQEQQESLLLCREALVGPISYGANNDTQEVEKLEEFLAWQGNAVESDGIYGASEFAAVKKLQEEYRETILDPWGINNPTGYVFTTTIKKIEEIACQ